MVRSDIASPIKPIYGIVKALDSFDGAAGDYREVVAFLRDLKYTMAPLRNFTSWNAYPAYRRDI
jgi:hypothetical protein